MTADNFQVGDHVVDDCGLCGTITGYVSCSVVWVKLVSGLEDIRRHVSQLRKQPINQQPDDLKEEPIEKPFPLDLTKPLEYLNCGNWHSVSRIERGFKDNAGDPLALVIFHDKDGQKWCDYVHELEVTGRLRYAKQIHSCHVLLLDDGCLVTRNDRMSIGQQLDFIQHKGRYKQHTITWEFE